MEFWLLMTLVVIAIHEGYHKGDRDCVVTGIDAIAESIKLRLRDLEAGVTQAVVPTERQKLVVAQQWATKAKRITEENDTWLSDEHFHNGLVLMQQCIMSEVHEVKAQMLSPSVSE